MSDVAPPPKRRRAMEPAENNADSSSPEPTTKRRKLRKGTKSCWDCKKRKVKCTFDVTSDVVCIACRRRGAPCIGQDQSEEEYQTHAQNNRDPLLDRIQRVEGLLEQVIQDSHNFERGVSPAGLGRCTQIKSGYFTPASDDQPYDSFNPLPASASCVATSTINMRMLDECRMISEQLIKAFPSQEDIDVFCKSDYIATFYCHQIFARSGERPESEAFDFVNDIARIPDPSTTLPVLVAKRMILFALFLQHFQSQHTRRLAEPPNVIMDRLVNTAVRLVTTNEEIFGCVEGLECIILEGVYQLNGGNLRRAWLAFRKALAIAQLMKLDHPHPPPAKVLDANTKANPKLLWFRIVYMDSYVSLMLGLSHGGPETNMESDDPNEKPSYKLERAHGHIAKRIIDRNRRDSFFQDFTATRQLDRELLDVAKSLPDKFWLVPNFTAIEPNTREAFWETMRLCDQLHHYNLVHLLHLPYLLHGDKESSYHTYARITCVNASREILSRCIAFRNFNRKLVTIYCRTSDFFALMASMTILLAHIDSHKLEVEDWRAHQRVGDRAMVEQLLEDLEEVGEHTNDSLTKQSACSLRNLLEMESDAARGISCCAQNTVSCIEERAGELQLSIPYFGIIKIGREGITKKGSTVPTLLQPCVTENPGSMNIANQLSAVGFGEVPHQSSQAGPFLPVPEVQPVQLPQMALANVNEEVGLYQRQLQVPGLVAGIDDWAFQGVDAAFFDSLMRGTVD